MGDLRDSYILLLRFCILDSSLVIFRHIQEKQRHK
jgi:hypothetical protein